MRVLALTIALAIDPPVMFRRGISQTALPYPGVQMEVAVDGLKATLFVPNSWNRKLSTIRVHVHTVPWFAIQEHLDGGLAEPLLVMNFGEGSTTYAKPFLDPDALPKWLRETERVLADSKLVPITNGGGIKGIQVSSFSAGYGAVREWMKHPQNRTLLKRVVLADSMYGSLDPDPANTTRRPLPEHVAVWAPFARDAMAGKTTFIITTSQIAPNSYCGTFEIARGLVEALKGTMIPAKDELAAKDPDFPLIERFDRGNLHVWNYGGTTTFAHTTHVRHIAETWRALNVTGRP